MRLAVLTALFACCAADGLAQEPRCGQERVLCARIAAGSKGNEFVVEVMNHQEETEHNLRLQVANAPRYVRDVRVEPRSLGELRPGERRTFTVGFDIGSIEVREVSDRLTLSLFTAEIPEGREQVSVLMTLFDEARPTLPEPRDRAPSPELVAARDRLDRILAGASGAAADCAAACRAVRLDDARAEVEAVSSQVAALSGRRPAEEGEDTALTALAQVRDEALSGRRTAEREAMTAQSEQMEACQIADQLRAAPDSAATLRPPLQAAAARASAAWHEADDGNATARRAASRAEALGAQPAPDTGEMASLQAELAALRGRIDAADSLVQSARGAAADARSRCGAFTRLVAEGEAALVALQDTGAPADETRRARERLVAVRASSAGCPDSSSALDNLAARLTASANRLGAMEVRAATMRASAAATRAAKVAALSTATRVAAVGAAASAAVARAASVAADRCAAVVVPGRPIGEPPGPRSGAAEGGARSGAPPQRSEPAGGGWDEALGGARRTERPGGSPTGAAPESMPGEDIGGLLAAAADAYAACDFAGAQALLARARAIVPLDPRIARLSGLIAQQSQAAGLYNAALQAASAEQALGLLAQADAAAGSAQTSPPCLKSRIADARTRGTAARTRDKAIADEQRSRDAWRRAADDLLGTLIPIYNSGVERGGGAPTAPPGGGPAPTTGGASGAAETPKSPSVGQQNYCHIQQMPRGAGDEAAVTLLLVRQTNSTLVQYAVHEVPVNSADLHASNWAKAGFSVLARYPTYDAAYGEARRRCPNPVVPPGF